MAPGQSITQPLAVLPAEREPPQRGMGTEANPVVAVLVLKDPKDWYRDVQLVLDLIMSGRDISQGTQYQSAHKGSQVVHRATPSLSRS
jgi:hypothetical protein